MGNIRHYRPSEVEVTVGGHRIQSTGDYAPGFTVELEPVVTVDCARSERIDRARFVEPLDASLSQSLREVHASDMTGAEKLAAIQALQRVTIENHCGECGGAGWVMTVVNQSYGSPAGEPEYDDCPQCNGGRL